MGTNRQKVYIAIDLKSFYASVECIERGLDPMQTNLVVADKSRTEKTICLAVSPSLKAYGVPGRARLFEVVQKVREVNAQRKSRAPGRTLSGSFQPRSRGKSKSLAGAGLSCRAAADGALYEAQHGNL
jgi:DNA polymerase V